MIVVSDTSPLRALSHLGLIGLLRELYHVVLVPPSVDRELRGSPPGLPEVRLDSFEFIHIKTPLDLDRVEQLQRGLDVGEAEALALALEVGVNVVLIDEQDGRAEATRMGLRPIGVLGILLQAKEEGLIEMIGPLIKDLRRETRFFVSRALLERVLRTAGE